ncbi:MAG: hypothetical protein P4L51_08545 [Puia sp.]|nr:hypothetical protein [Puia sp.]
MIPCLLFALETTPASAQFDTSYVKNADDYIAEIDSLEHAEKLTTGISEGSITTTTMKVVYDTAESKNDTSWLPNVIGGFSLKYTYQNDTVLKLLYHDNTDKNIYETYYFRNKQLICAKVRLEANGIGTILYHGVQYYKNAKIVCAQFPPSEAPKEYRGRVLFSWRDAGTKYYEQITTGSR